ncbi:MAG: trypsin-like peptidase domain-containing protein [Rhodobacteraceae bacterium]|nr:trypsin-like peptidase domain-containing protein [Paracoccaceae bacterium]
MRAIPTILVAASMLLAPAGTAWAQADVLQRSFPGGAALPPAFDTPEERRAVPALAWTGGAAAGGPAGGGPEDAAGAAAPVILPAGLPHPDADAEARRRFADDWALAALPAPPAATAEAEGTVATFTQYRENAVAFNLDFTQRTIGKLFFTAPGGDATCSGAVVSGNNLVVTAAHCCYTPGSGFHTNFTFFPGYRLGASPFGGFTARTAVVPAGWRTGGFNRRKNDVCLLRMRPNRDGRDITFFTGHLGLGMGLPYVQSLHAVGYPGNIGGTEFMELCTAESFRPPRGCGRDNVLNMGCSMTFGSSGGPWVAGYRGSNLVTGVVSGYDDATCTGPFGTTFNGPRFTAATIGKLCDRLGGC